MSSAVHPTAIVEAGARLADGVKIGPFCIVGADVTLGEDVELISHAVVTGRTTIGPRTKIYPNASIGHQPQDLKYAGEASSLEIGADNTIREQVTVNPGTQGGGMVTRVGDHCLLMIGAHVGHDCQVGNNVILSNNVSLAGHCRIDDYAIVSGHVGVIQHTHIGAHAFIGALSKVERDVIPYGTVNGYPAELVGLNLVGLKRRGFDREAIHTLRAAYRMIFSSEGTLRERVDDAKELFTGEALVQDIVGFIVDAKDRALTLPRNGHSDG
ncbi:MAG: acyl-ACP--UDP-N-acetylglucosamine O-acyltransferase [Devosia sp.]